MWCAGSRVAASRPQSCVGVSQPLHGHVDARRLACRSRSCDQADRATKNVPVQRKAGFFLGVLRPLTIASASLRFCAGLAQSIVRAPPLLGPQRWLAVGHPLLILFAGVLS